MRILAVNDDGIASQRLGLLVRALAARGHEVHVFAPAEQQSCRGHSFTLYAPVLVEPRTVEGAASAWAVSGLPTDCTRIGLMGGLLPGRPDLVISGINDGYNIGLAIYVSGTVGAAQEASFLGYPAMAVSMAQHASDETASFFAEWIATVAEKMPAFNLPQRAVLSLNCPAIPVSRIKGARFCGLNQNVYKDGYEKRISPKGVMYFWSTPETPDDDPTEYSDAWWLKHDYLTCTVLNADIADQTAYETLLENL